MPRVLGGSEGGGRFHMGEVPLYGQEAYPHLPALRTLQGVLELKVGTP